MAQSYTELTRVFFPGIIALVDMTKSEPRTEDFTPESIASALRTKFIGRNLLFFPSVPSTMEEAHRVAGEGAAEGTVVLADEQTSGKGRFGRVWHTPKGTSIATSVILRPSLKELPRLNMVASLAVVKSIEKVCGLEARVKWPNDVLVGDKKVCGILVDSSLRGQELEYAIIGIGLNVNLDMQSLPDISTIATSLSNEMGRGVSRLKVLLFLFKEMEALYLELKKGRPLHKKWRSYLVTLDREVILKRGDTVLEGRAEDVDEDGALLLRLPDGSLERVVSGEVTLTFDQR